MGQMGWLKLLYTFIKTKVRNGKSFQKWFYNRLSVYAQQRHENHILRLSNSTYE